MGETLAAQCSAINEFREFLGEESISKLSIDGDAVEFSVQTSGNKLHFLYQADDATTHHPLLLCTNQDSLNLEALNAKLAQGNYSLGKTLSSLGRQLHIDLDWALEALNELQGGDGDAGDDGSGDRASDDGNDDDDENMSEGEDQGDDILREWSKKMLQLEAIEQQKANDATKNKTASVEIDHSQKQIFDTKAAFRRLLNELEEIFKAQDMNLMVDAPGPEGLFQWEVYLAGFSSEKGNLAADLHQTGRRFGLSSVHLQITFKRGLHPFYPPSVHILSPRVQGPVLGAVACFPMLHPKVWDPVVSAKDIILNIKEFLEENARVDLESSNQNYHPTELLISRLSALTGIQPIDPAISPETVFSFDQQHHNGGYSFKSPADAAVGGSGAGNGNGGSGIGEPKPLLGKEEIKPDNPTSKKLRTVADSEPAPPSGTATNIDIVAEMQNPTGLEEKSGEPQGTPPPESPSQQSKSPKPIAWNKGVGYGSGAGVKNKKVWDAKRAEALQDARDAELYDVLSSLAQAAEKAFKDTTTVEEAMKVDGVDKPEESSGDEEKRIVVTALKSGCLVPFLLKELSSAGFQGMASRASYYRALLQCVHVLCLHPETASMLCWHAEDDLKSLATAMASLKAQGATFLRVLGDQAAGSLDHQIEDDSQLATLLLTVAKEVETLTSSSPPSLDPSPPAEDGSNPLPLTNDTQMPTAPTSEDVSEAHYVSIMSPFKVSLVPGIATNHVYQSNASKEPTAASRQRARRVASELASLESDLPINASSSVFVCADEQQTVLWKAMITGPKGTPYESGCFLFDIYFPGEYPHKAPSVQLRTTGGGTVRFNPNLYNCGKVCLSLLGTWQGEKGESWSAEYSSILQVLISIQSLILVDQPFYNEPGYESRPDNQASDAYSADIMQHTVKWAMLDQLQSPPEYFAEAIKSHFRERGEVVLTTVRRWEKWCTDIGALGPAAAIEKMLPELENEISKLKNV